MKVLVGPDGPVIPLIEYLQTRRMSRDWEDWLVRGMRLFLNYLELNTIPGAADTTLFQNFANALRDGTVDVKTHWDPSGLYWRPMLERDAGYMLSRLTEFFDHLATVKGVERAARFNPTWQGTRYEQIVADIAYQYQRNSAFLGHTWEPKTTRKARLAQRGREPKTFTDRPPAFPENRIEELIFKGFKRPTGYEYRDMAITLLLVGAGLRVSEPFHMYVQDVTHNPQDRRLAQVVIHHPSIGAAPDNWRNAKGEPGRRDEYLAAKFGLLPRHQMLGNAHAGWKNPTLDAQWYMKVRWFPQEYAEWFMWIWERYLNQILNLKRDHPFAWVNIEQNPGGIYQIKQYGKKLEGAVTRIGLPFGKAFGTTAHGGRHAYGQRVRRAEIDPRIIQRLMHHGSFDSQQVYTQPDLDEVQSAISGAADRLRQTKTNVIPRPVSALELD